MFTKAFFKNGAITVLFVMVALWVYSNHVEPMLNSSTEQA